jgi:hypothetical protein
VPKTLVESWNGTKWSVMPTRNKASNSNYLNEVSCGRATACNAVGFYQKPGTPLQLQGQVAGRVERRRAVEPVTSPIFMIR